MQVLVVRGGGSGQGGRGRWRERSGPLRSCILDFRLSIPQGRGGVEGTCPLAPVCPWGKVHPGFNPWLLHVCVGAIASLGMPAGTLRCRGVRRGGSHFMFICVESVRAQGLGTDSDESRRIWRGSWAISFLRVNGTCSFLSSSTQLETCKALMPCTDDLILFWSASSTPGHL